MHKRTVIVVIDGVDDVSFFEEVVPGSPAAQAGLKPDDLIVYFDGELVPTVKVYRDLMKVAAPGSEIKLDVQRGTRLVSVKVKVAEQPKLKAAN